MPVLARPMMRRSAIVLAVATMVLFIAMAAMWWRELAEQTAAQNSDVLNNSVLLLASGDTRGWIVPCGCAANQAGGLPRRGSLVAERRQHHDVILVDVGGAPGGVSPYERVKFEAILKGELRMGIAAHNVGDPEAQLGPEYLRRISADLNVPLVSANLRDQQGQLVAESHRIISVDRHVVLIVGVLSPQYANDGLTIDAPRDAILSVITNAPKYESLVVLAYLPETELRQLAASLPEADVIVGGPTGQSIAPTTIGPLVLTSATNKGKFMVEVPLHSAAEALDQAGRVIELGASLADDIAQQDNLREFYAELERRDFSPIQTDFLPTQSGDLPVDYRIAGTDSCRKCHARDCHVWDASKHARAWQTLVARSAQYDSYCQQCHTTGYHLPGGFTGVRSSPDRVQVGCESCHGPAQAHVANPTARTAFMALDQCITCHDRENSPNFDYASYWTKIVHGSPTAEKLE